MSDGGETYMKIDGIENDDREIVVNTVTQKEQSGDTETEQMRPRGGKVTGTKEQDDRKKYIFYV